MSVATLVSCVLLYLTSGVVIPYFQDQGFSPADAAMYQSVYMLALAGAKLLCGALCDKIGPKPVTIICMVCAAAGQWILGVTADPILSYVGILLFAVGLCMSSIMIPMLSAPLFGYQACLSVNGIFLAMASLATIFSSPISNLFYDKIGSYSPVFRVAAIANGILIAVYFLMFAMAKREKALFKAREKG
jgi:MFS family permease